MRPKGRNQSIQVKGRFLVGIYKEKVMYVGKGQMLIIKSFVCM